MDYLQIVLLFCFIHGHLATVVYECADEGSNDLDEATLEISEVSPTGTVIAVFNGTYAPLQLMTYVNGTDEDALTSFFTTEKIGINTYSLMLTKPVDLELLQMQQVLTPVLLDTMDMTIQCETRTGVRKLRTFHVTISPVNEFHPVFLKAPYTVTVPETKQVGTELFRVKEKTVDMDFGYTTLTFGISPYTISEFDGRRYISMDDPLSGVIRLVQPLDFETFIQRGRNYFFINVTVSDDGGLTSVTSINVTVLDSNDQGIEFVYPDCPRPCLNPNFTVITNESYTGVLEVAPVPIKARDLDTLRAPVKYSLVTDEDSRYFRIEETSGKLFQIAPLANDSYGNVIALQVMASERDNDRHFLTTNVTILIVERMPSTDDASDFQSGGACSMAGQRLWYNKVHLYFPTPKGTITLYTGML